MSEGLLQVIAYVVGWRVCRVLSFGKYPKGAILDNTSRSDWSDVGIMFVGLLVIFLPMIFMFVELSL